MSSVYIAYTPYHVMISCGLAKRCDSSNKKILIIISDFKDSDILTKNISDWKNNPFTAILSLRGKFGLGFTKVDKIQRLLISRNNVKYIKKMLFHMDPGCTAFIFNDMNPESQIIAYLNSNLNGRNFYVEDGFAAYGVSKSNAIKYYEICLMNLLWGHYYEHVAVMGTYTYINKLLVFCPKFVRPELKHKDIIRLPQKVLSDSMDLDLISRMLEFYGIFLDSLDIKYILIVKHSDGLIQQNLMDKYKTICKHIIDRIPNNNILYVKYHPREYRTDFLSVKINRKVNILPQSLPIELLYLALKKKNPLIIFGDYSTSLLTGMYLFEKIKIISIATLFGMINPDLEIILQNFEIMVPHDIGELDNEITLLSKFWL